LTIIATLVTDTGLPIDDVVASEVAGSATMEIHVSHDVAAKRLFPAIDIAHSQTRKEELLLAKDEAGVVAEIRRALGATTPDVAMATVVENLKSTSSNVEFLVSMQKKLPTLGL
jgi:transcription termination factor Rho